MLREGEADVLVIGVTKTPASGGETENSEFEVDSPSVGIGPWARPRAVIKVWRSADATPMNTPT